MPPIPTTERPCADDVDAPLARVRNVAHEFDVDEHDQNDDVFEQERDAPRQVGRDEAADQWPDRRRDSGSRADERVRLLLRGAFEVAVDERLHGREQERRTEAADDGPEDDDRGEALGERHRKGADRVAHQAEDVRPFPADEVADLAADQDERGRNERFQCDRRLDSAHGRVEVFDDGRDRHVHERRVDDEHEHRHRQQNGEAPVAAGRRADFGCLAAHALESWHATEQREPSSMSKDDGIWKWRQHSRPRLRAHRGTPSRSTRWHASKRSIRPKA